MAPRGKYAALDLKTKAEIIKKVANGVKKSDIAQQYGIKRSTLSTFIKNKAAILDATDNSTFGKKRMRMRTAANKELEDTLIFWMKEARSKNMPISGPILKGKAEDLALKLDLEGFKCSDGWLARFKSRNGIVYRQVCGESGDVNEVLCAEWKNSLHDKIHGYSPSDIFNADETGLFFKQLPNKTLTFKDDPCVGGKASKLRVTVLLATNMDGSEKLMPLVIGKSSKPRCFKGLRTLPVNYQSNPKSWINHGIFNAWLKNLDMQFSRQKRKILLFIDNATPHTKFEELNLISIKVVFFPATTTSILQPMDQGIIQNFKVHYRRRLLQRLLLCMDNAKTYKPTLLTAIQFIKAAWDEVLPSTVSNCFKKSGFGEKQETVSETETEVPDENLNPCPGQDWWEKETFEDYVSVDSDLQTCGLMTDEEIIQVVKACDEESSEDEELVVPTDMEIENSTESIRKFLMLQNGCETELLNLSKIEKLALHLKDKNKKQTTINQFFNK